jgi:hypothetical protein
VKGGSNDVVQGTSDEFGLCCIAAIETGRRMPIFSGARPMERSWSVAGGTDRAEQAGTVRDYPRRRVAPGSSAKATTA